MKYIKRIHIWLLTAVLLLACRSKVEDNSRSDSIELTQNEIWNPVIILSREEDKIVEAKSEKLYKNNNADALLVGNVEVDFFNEVGQHISILYSDSVWINEQNNNLRANENVHVVSDSGYTLTTNEILWDNRYKMIVAEDSVMFTTTEGDTLHGVGFESDMDLEQWKIFRIFGVTREGI